MLRSPSPAPRDSPLPPQSGQLGVLFALSIQSPLPTRKVSLWLLFLNSLWNFRLVGQNIFPSEVGSPSPHPGSENQSLLTMPEAISLAKLTL